MKALTKAMREERQALVEALRTTFTALEQDVERFNTAMQAAWDEVETSKELYNAAVENANDWKRAVAAEIQTIIDERSEKWQESARGQAYQGWLSEYEYGDLEPADLEIPGVLELSSDDQADQLEGLSEEVP